MAVSEAAPPEAGNSGRCVFAEWEEPAGLGQGPAGESVEKGVGKSSILEVLRLLKKVVSSGLARIRVNFSVLLRVNGGGSGRLNLCGDRCCGCVVEGVVGRTSGGLAVREAGLSGVPSEQSFGGGGGVRVGGPGPGAGLGEAGLSVCVRMSGHG